MPDPSRETLPPARRAALIAARDEGSVWFARGYAATSAFHRMVGMMIVEGVIRSNGSLTAAGLALIGGERPRAAD